MSINIRTATEADVLPIAEMVNEFAAKDIMLPRSEAGIRQTLADWLIAEDGPVAGEDAGPQPTSKAEHDSGARPRLAGCGSLVPLTETLVEIRSLATHTDYQGQGIGGRLVNELVQLARERGFEQVCALTLRAGFFVRLGFEEVDRWSISPKVWQACIYCRKFHHCDEVAVLMNLVDEPSTAKAGKPAAWNSLMRWSEWQPLRLAYQQKRTHETHENVTET